MGDEIAPPVNRAALQGNGRPERGERFLQSRRVIGDERVLGLRAARDEVVEQGAPGRLVSSPMLRTARPRARQARRAAKSTPLAGRAGRARPCRQGSSGRWTPRRAAVCPRRPSRLSPCARPGSPHPCGQTRRTPCQSAPDPSRSGSRQIGARDQGVGPRADRSAATCCATLAGSRPRSSAEPRNSDPLQQ